MKKLSISLMFALCGLFFPIQGSSAIYKWVDENGRITFKDTPPPAGVAAEIFVPKNPVAGYDVSPEISSGNVPRNSALTEKAKSHPKVEIYVTKWCPSCRKAVDYLNAIGVPYTKYDIEEDPAAKDRFLRKYHQKSIPFAVIGEEKITGFNKERFDSALGIKPKSE